MKVAIIGAGNMGGSLACGLAKGKLIPASRYNSIQPQHWKAGSTKERISFYCYHSQ